MACVALSLDKAITYSTPDAPMKQLLRYTSFLAFWVPWLPCAAQAPQALADSLAAALGAAAPPSDNRAALRHYEDSYTDDGAASKSIGTVSQGTLAHGKLIPFQGDNFGYYDTISYLDDRAFVHDKVLRAVLATYQDMAVAFPGRRFTIMECSKKTGGKIWPHRTHQNGMSIDFMVPMSQGTAAFYGLDTLGFQHYLLEYNADGSISGQPDVKIDFDIVAVHLLALQKRATAQGLKISKVLFQKELLDELFASAHGAALRASKLYFPTGLEPLINQLHDNHYHVDFAPL
jgi:penicillin-insensitive murein DD-endopeptidase